MGTLTPMGRTILVTGAARHLGARMCRVLSHEMSVDRVIGVDVVPPRSDLGRAEFIRADIRNPVIGKIIGAAAVDTVVHMGVIATPLQAGGRATMKDINVIGTMQLLAACQKSDSVQRLIVKSTASVYGCGPRDPVMFTEETAPQHPPTSGWAKDSVEVEGYVRGFARRRSDVAVTILRFANIIGPDVDTAMTSYFSLPVIPTVFGHDARLQFVHEDDHLEATRLVSLSEEPVSGVFNVSGAGVIMLSQAVRRIGRPALPVIGGLLGTAGRSMGSTGLADFSAEQVRYLTYGRAIDTSRIEDELGFWPRWTTAEAFADFIRGHHVQPLVPTASLLSAQQRILSVLTTVGGLVPTRAGGSHGG